MKLGISVPVGTWHDFLPSALESLTRQTGEVAIALLDASGDRRVKSLADQYDAHLAYRRHGPDSGQSDAILEGWAKLDADWLGWLNADDILLPEAVETARARLAEDPDLEAVYGHSVILDETGAMTGYHFNVEPPGDRLLQAGIISQPSCFFSRAAYDRAGGLDRSLHYVMDWDLWIRMYKSGAKFGFIDSPMSMVLWGAGTKTASLNRRRRAELKLMISRHAPPEVRKSTFRDFTLHALADRISLPALRKKITQRLRRPGHTVYGVRADGRLAESAVLTLAHYEARPKTGVALHFDEVPDGLTASIDGEPLAVRTETRRALVTFSEPLGAGGRIDLEVSHAAASEPFFKRAAWTAG